MRLLGPQPIYGQVITSSIAADAVTSAKIGDDQIDSEHYAAGSIDTAHIATNQIDETLTKDALIADFSDVTITASDLILFGDQTDSNNSKRDTVQGLLDLASGGLTLGTEQATTSGTTIDFTSIPAGVKLIFITLEGVSLSGSAQLVIQLGDSGGFETSGYVAGGALVQAGGAAVVATTAGFTVRLGAAAFAAHGQIVLTLSDSSNFTWICSHSLLVDSSDGDSSFGGGSKSLSAELTQIRLTHSNSNTFDAGAANISYM